MHGFIQKVCSSNILVLIVGVNNVANSEFVSFAEMYPTNVYNPGIDPTIVSLTKHKICKLHILTVNWGYMKAITYIHVKLAGHLMSCVTVNE